MSRAISSVALEQMKIQKNDSFVEEATAIFNSIRKAPIITDEILKQSGLSNLIRTRFGMNTTIKLQKASYPNATVMIPIIAKKHPLSPYARKNDGKSARAWIKEYGRDGSAIGEVNLKTCKVTGFFADMDITIAFTEPLLKHPGISDRAVTAILLHEIGHYFFNCYLLKSTAATNFVCNFIISGLGMANNDEERRIIIRDGGDVLGIPELDPDPFLTLTPKQSLEMLQALYINNENNAMRNELGAGLYDFRADEMLADYFASRFNVSADVAEGLAAMHGRGSTLRNRHKAQIANVIMGMCIAGATITTGGFGLVLIPFLASNAIFHNVGIYDKPHERVATFKRYAIQNLKDGAFDDKEFMNETMNQIERLERLAKEYHDVPSVAVWLADRLSRRSKAIKRTRDLQKNIEDLIMNEAFLAAAKFQKYT